jgi:hypothetical protein
MLESMIEQAEKDDNLDLIIQVARKKLESF